MTVISIVRADESDAQALIKVQNQAYFEDYTRYGHCPAYNEPIEQMLDLIQNAIVYKILSDGRIIGDIIVRRRENNLCYLRVISVIPEFWNLGIGTMAIRFIEKDNPDAVEWSLITPGESLRNHHFYEKMGYHKTGEMTDPEHMVLWEYKKRMGQS